MRKCTKCGETDQSNFFKTGYYCKSCYKLWLREYRQTEKGKQVHRNYDRKRSRNKAANKIKNDRKGVSGSMSTRIRQSLKSDKKGRHWEELVEYTLEDLKYHLENKFKPGMSWENHGLRGWHIDHIRPVSSFNITSYECEDFKKCWSLDNLQPLWWRENLQKGDRII